MTNRYTLPIYCLYAFNHSAFNCKTSFLRPTPNLGPRKHMSCRMMVIPASTMSQGHMVSPRSLFTLVPGEISQPEAQNQPEHHLAIPWCRLKVTSQPYIPG